MHRLLRKAPLCALLAVGAPIAAIAQDTPPASVAPLPVPAEKTPVMALADVPADACQIHVWSTPKIKSYVSGFAEAMGGALGAVLDGKRADEVTVEEMLRRVLEGRPQATLLSQLDLATMLNLPNAVIVPNAEPTDPLKWKSAKGRLIEGTAPCYVELIVRDMYFNKSALFPPSVRVNFTMRDFRGGRAKPLISEGRGGIKLPVYPGVSTIDEAVITRTFQDAYVGAFVEFATEQQLLASK